MDLYLVRHARPIEIAGVCYGRSEVAAPISTEEITQLRSKLPQITHSVYSSPRQRCLEVAKAISNDVEIVHELAELDFGNWEMRSWDEIGPDNLDEWIASGYAAIHEGESLTNFDERTQNWLRNIEALAQPTVVAVTHAGTMRSLLRHALAIELDASLQFKVEFLQPLHLQMVDGAWQLLESEL